METWKDIPITDLCRYEISDLGNMRHKKFKRILKFSIPDSRAKNKCYYQTKVSCPTDMTKSKTYLIHRLVAITFLGDMEEDMVVNHINNIKTDNRLINLEWLSKQHNQDHYFNNFHEYKTDRKLLSKGRIIKIFNKNNWNDAEEFLKELLSEADESNLKWKESKSLLAQ